MTTQGPIKEKQIPEEHAVIPEEQAQEEPGHAQTQGIENIRAATATTIEGLPHLSKNTKRPRLGASNYLHFKLDSLSFSSEEEQNDFYREIETLSGLSEFIIQAREGHVFIFGQAERSGVGLMQIAANLTKLSPSIKVIIGECNFIEVDNKFKMKGGPLENMINFAGQSTNRILLTQSFADRYHDPSTRESSTARITVASTGNPNLVSLERILRLVSLETEIPDKIFGYEKERETLLESIKDPNVKIVLLKAPAGLGKTRILGDALKGEDYLACSHTADTKGLPGASLAGILHQLHDTLMSDPLFEGDTPPLLADFLKQPLSVQAINVTTNPQDHINAALSVIKTLIGSSNRPVLPIEDVHHSDLGSEGPIQDLIQRCLLDRENLTGNPLVIITMRENEMSHSPALNETLRKIAETYGNDAIREIYLNGLDFTDSSLCYQFAFHSIPELQRGSKNMEDNKAKSLGTWPEKLGEIASKLGNSPHVMLTLIQRAMERAKIDDTSITVLAEDLDQITIINSQDDLATLQHERIRKLGSESRTLLFAFAVMGGKITFDKLHKILIKIHPENSAKSLVYLNELESKGFVGKIFVAEQEFWGIRHDLLTEFVFEAIKNDEQSRELALKLHKIITKEADKEPDEMPDSRFFLLNNIIQNLNNSLNPELLNDLQNAAAKLLDKARERFDWLKIYTVAQAVLKSSGKSRNERNIITFSIDELLKGGDVPPNISGMIIETLTATIESAGYLGKFRESEEAAKILEEISDKNPNLNIDLGKIRLHLFHNAYMKGDRELMSNIRQKIDIDELKPLDKASILIKFAYMNNDYEELYRLGEEAMETIINENKRFLMEKGMPSPEATNLMRILKIRAPFEQLRIEIKNLPDYNRDGTSPQIRLDSDVSRHPSVLTPEQKAKLAEIQKYLQKMQATIDQYPSLLGPYERISALEQSSQVSSYNEESAPAASAAAEAHRQADRLGVYHVAARTAIIEAGIHASSALFELQNGRINKDKLLKALKVLRTKAEPIVKNYLDPNNVYSLMLHGERIRYTGLLACIGEIDEGALNTALEDYRELRETTWSPASDEDMYSYYSYMAYVIEQAEIAGIPLPEELQNDFTMENVNAGLAFGENITDLGYGDCGIKNTGLYKLRERARRQRDLERLKK